MYAKTAQKRLRMYIVDAKKIMYHKQTGLLESFFESIINRKIVLNP